MPAVAAPRRADGRRQRRRRPAAGGRAARRDLAGPRPGRAAGPRPSRPAAAGSVALVGGGPGRPRPDHRAWPAAGRRGRRRRRRPAGPARAARRPARRRRGDRLRQVGAPAQPDPGRDQRGARRAGAAGKRVVRLKGGDPFVFGRGGEEWLACVAAGVPVTVVPGISSALAAPAARRHPVDPSRGGGRLHGRVRPPRPGTRGRDGIDWPGLAAGAGTLVLLMAMDRLDLIADELIEHGRAAATPAAVVHRATLPGEQVVRAPLDELAAAVARGGHRGTGGRRDRRRRRRPRTDAEPADGVSATARRRTCRIIVAASDWIAWDAT